MSKLHWLPCLHWEGMSGSCQRCRAEFAEKQLDLANDRIRDLEVELAAWERKMAVENNSVFLNSGGGE